MSDIGLSGRQGPSCVAGLQKQTVRGPARPSRSACATTRDGSLAAKSPVAVSVSVSPSHQETLDDFGIFRWHSLRERQLLNAGSKPLTIEKLLKPIHLRAIGPFSNQVTGAVQAHAMTPRVTRERSRQARNCVVASESLVRPLPQALAPVRGEIQPPVQQMPQTWMLQQTAFLCCSLNRRQCRGFQLLRVLWR